MKFCPTCETRYDEEILRFCTKDGTPLVDENQPNFTELPSESIVEDAEPDLGEETVVRYKPPKDLLKEEPEPQPDIERSEAPRIVISTNEQKKEQNVRARQIPPYQPVPQKQNTGRIVLLTILGTLAALAVILGLFIFLRNDEPANLNMNVNTNPPESNLNTNLNIGGTNYNVSTNTNFNFNSNFNVNTNFNVNANLRTPTPTPTPKPSPTTDANANLGNTNVIGTPTPTPRPANTSTPPRTATPTPNATPRVSPTLPPGRPVNNSN